MNRDAAAVVAIKEERTRIGNVDITKQTAIIATDEGVLAYEVNTVQRQQPLPYRTGYGAAPALTYPKPEGKNCCEYCWCECDSNFKWYDLEGKGCFMVLLLLLMYLIIGTIFLPFVIIYCLLYCFCGCFKNENE